MPFRPGHSGNPNGRPPKFRALTDLLSLRGDAQVTLDGEKLSGGELLARLLWQIATTGKAKFPDGTELIVGPKDWLETVKWLYVHIDGPAPKPEPEDPDDELTDEDLEAMSDAELEALIKRRQRRKGAGRGK
ncbi:MAG TPA: DUF5681 domain-containing protein [Pyrinomonadaceae bacterium]|nr:DUF5681 domain-containing protein [Pyrinomonadaceae bacterium]